MTVQLHQLEYFVAVAQLRHFTRAAESVHIAQPSLSKQIRVLERELGTPLFSRARGNVTLTPAGETLLPFARRILADGQLDMALIILPLHTRDPALRTAPILREPLVVAVRADASPIRTKTVSVR